MNIRNWRKASIVVSDFIKHNTLATCCLVVLVASLIFGIRNIAAFTMPNFYAEDATIIFQNIYTEDALRATLSPFNGYFVVGQYILGYFALIANLAIGGGLQTLPIMTAIVSCTFLGFIASLPFILFRKQLSIRLVLLVVLLTALIPLKSFDYAIIGTLGNLKFAFLYAAFLFVVYRLVDKNLTFKKYLLIDGFLLLCALTNVTVAFLLPLILLPYIPKWWSALRSKRTKWSFNVSQLSAVGLVAVTSLYTIVAVLRGIPKIPGYLEGPFKLEATLPIIDRSLYYALLYPFTASFNNYFVAGMLISTVAVFLWLFVRREKDRYVLFAAFWAIFLGTVLFVVNRPGVGEYYLTYGHKGGPDQFFYAQNMVFIFALAWIIKDQVKKMSLRATAWVGILLVLYMLLAIPHGTSFGGSTIVYQSMQPIGPNVDKACKQYANQEDVIIQVYPTPYWQWKVDRDLACDP